MIFVKHEEVDIILRPWEMEDLIFLVTNANNAKIAANLTDAFPCPYNLEDGIAFLSKIKNDSPIKIFAIVVNGEPSGSIGIFQQQDINRLNAELGYWIAEKWWGRGIMTEVVKEMVKYGFDTYPINRIYARPFPTNIGSQKVLQKAGFMLEAIIKDSLIKNNVIVDELICAVRRQII